MVIRELKGKAFARPTLAAKYWIFAPGQWRVMLPLSGEMCLLVEEVGEGEGGGCVTLSLAVFGDMNLGQIYVNKIV